MISRYAARRIAWSVRVVQSFSASREHVNFTQMCCQHLAANDGQVDRTHSSHIAITTDAQQGVTTKTEVGLSANVIDIRSTFMKRLRTAKPGGDWRAAEAVLKDVLERSDAAEVVDVYMYNAAVSVVSSKGNWRSAGRIVDLMRTNGMQPDKVTYNAFMSACRQGGQWQKALALLREMQVVGDPVVPDVISYNTAISACGRGRQWEQSVALLREMQGRGSSVAPTLVTYNTTITACGNSGEWKQAVALLRELQEDLAGLAPDVVSYNTAIAACSRRGQWRQAVGLLREMQREGSSVKPNAITYRTVMKVCEKSKQLDLAVRLVKEMRQQGMSPFL